MTARVDGQLVGQLGLEALPEAGVPVCVWCSGPVYRDCDTCSMLCDRRRAFYRALCGLPWPHPYPEAQEAAWRRLEALCEAAAPAAGGSGGVGVDAGGVHPPAAV